MTVIDLDIFTGTLKYREIDFLFIFDKRELRLIPPKDKKFEIEHEWFMHKIREGVYAAGIDDHPEMDEPLLTGVCNENGSRIIFITQQGARISRYNSVLRVEIVAFIVQKYGENQISKIYFSSPEINHIHSIGQSFTLEYDKTLSQKGIIQLSTTEFDSVTTEEEEFEYDSKIIKVKFGSSRVIRHGLTDTPIKINSLLGFEFEATDDYVFVYQLWRVAKQFVQYLCYRENVFFSNVELLAHYEKGKYIGAGELYVLSDLERCDVEEEILKRGYYIRQKDIEGAVGAILQSIADNTIYLRHLPKSHEDGCHMDAARFIMLTAAFEWEFRRIFPNGIKKSEKEINAEETVIQLLDSMIEDNTGKTKKILRHLKKNVRNNSLSRKLNFVGLELGNIINVFGEYLYKLNGEKLKYSELGERLSGQRNNYAHGNLDKDFDALSLLDLIYLERIIYAMQLKFYGIEDLKIKKAINNLFQAHIRIEE